MNEGFMPISMKVFKIYSAAACGFHGLGGSKHQNHPTLIIVDCFGQVAQTLSYLQRLRQSSLVGNGPTSQCCLKAWTTTITSLLYNLLTIT